MSLANTGPATVLLSDGKQKWSINLKESTQRNLKTKVVRSIYFGPAYAPAEIIYTEPEPGLVYRQVDNEPSWKESLHFGQCGDGQQWR